MLPAPLPPGASQEWEENKARRETITARVCSLLGADGVMVLPTTPGAPLPLGLPNAAVDDWRRRLISLTCIAGLSGLPQARGMHCIIRFSVQLLKYVGHELWRGSEVGDHPSQHCHASHVLHLGLAAAPCTHRSTFPLLPWRVYQWD
jgi:hypothetical protein